MPIALKSAGTSKSCLSCRRRRKRCDLGNPCQRCVSSGTACSGPVQGPVFVNSNESSLKTRSHRGALQHAIAERRHINDVQVEGADKATVPPTSTLCHNNRTISPCIAEAMIDLGPRGQYYTCLIEDFQRTPFAAVQGQSICNGMIIHSDVAICMQMVASLACSSPKDLHCLDLAIFSLLNLYIGKMCRDDTSQVDLARRSYITALQGFRRELQRYSIGVRTERAHLLRSQKLFCLCLALILFELVDEHKLTENSDRHIDGALEILRLAGPAILKSKVMQRVFNAFRGLAFSSAARRRLHLFLDEPEWLSAPLRGKSKRRLEQLYDIALGLPRLLQRTDLIKGAWYTDDRDIGLLMYEDGELLQDYVNLECRLRQWHRLQLLQDRSRHDNHLNQPHNQPFVDKDLSGGQLHLATMLLELDMGLRDLLSMPERSLDPSLTTQQSPTVSELAAIVAKGTQRLTQQKEGRLIASVPSDTLTRYYSGAAQKMPHTSPFERREYSVNDFTRTL